MPKSNRKVTEKSTGREDNKSKIPITFNSEQLKLIEGYKGILGNTKAEIIRNIVINWMLSNKFSGGKKDEEDNN
jgi:hypothetical protein